METKLTSLFLRFFQCLLNSVGVFSQTSLSFGSGPIRKKHLKPGKSFIFFFFFTVSYFWNVLIVVHSGRRHFSAQERQKETVSLIAKLTQFLIEAPLLSWMYISLEYSPHRSKIKGVKVAAEIGIYS